MLVPKSLGIRVLWMFFKKCFTLCYPSTGCIRQFQAWRASVGREQGTNAEKARDDALSFPSNNVLLGVILMTEQRSTKCVSWADYISTLLNCRYQALRTYATFLLRNKNALYRKNSITLLSFYHKNLRPLQ